MHGFSRPPDMPDTFWYFFYWKLLICFLLLWMIPRGLSKDLYCTSQSSIQPTLMLALGSCCRFVPKRNWIVGSWTTGAQKTKTLFKVSISKFMDEHVGHGETASAKTDSATTETFEHNYSSWVDDFAESGRRGRNMTRMGHQSITGHHSHLKYCTLTTWGNLEQWVQRKRVFKRQTETRARNQTRNPETQCSDCENQSFHIEECILYCTYTNYFTDW